MFDEDLSGFLDDFGVSVTWGAESFVGIFDSPDDLIAGGAIISTEFALLVKSSDINGLLDGAMIAVEGSEYIVRQRRAIDDGKLTRLVLSKA